MRHGVFELDGGESVFAKGAGGAVLRSFFETEVRVYEAVESEFVPRFLGADVADSITLVLEDLSRAQWPSPWDDRLIQQAFAALDGVHAVTPPPGLPRSEQAELDAWTNWSAVAAKGERVAAATGLPGEWLSAHAETLRGFASSARVGGDALVHGDAHAGNVCSIGDRAVWIDWSSAHLGDPAQDAALLTISIAADGGPLCDLTDNALAIVASNAALWLEQAPEPPPAWAPGLRAIASHLWTGALRLLVAAGIVPDPARS